MNFKSKQIDIIDYGYRLDGGTLTVCGKDENGNEYKIMLGQRMMLETTREYIMPGRLYINDQLIEMRSDLEKQVLQLLKSASISYKSKKDKALIKQSGFDSKQIIRNMMDEMIEFVESEEYLNLPEKIKIIE